MWRSWLPISESSSAAGWRCSAGIAIGAVIAPSRRQQIVPSAPLTSRSTVEVTRSPYGAPSARAIATAATSATATDSAVASK